MKEPAKRGKRRGRAQIVLTFGEIMALREKIRRPIAFEFLDTSAARWAARRLGITARPSVLRRCLLGQRVSAHAARGLLARLS